MFEYSVTIQCSITRKLDWFKMVKKNDIQSEIP